MATRVKRKRKRPQRTANDDRLAALHREITHRLGRWRVLKAEFDRVHRAGLGALRRKQFDRLTVAILREHRLIEKQNVIIQEATAWLNRHKAILRKP